MSDLSPVELSIMRSLAVHCERNENGARPMDIGGSDGSYHSATLKALAKRGLVDRVRRNTICNMINSRRGSYLYKINDAGLAAIERNGGMWKSKRGTP